MASGHKHMHASLRAQTTHHAPVVGDAAAVCPAEAVQQDDQDEDHGEHDVADVPQGQALVDGRLRAASARVDAAHDGEDQRDRARKRQELEALCDEGIPVECILAAARRSRSVSPVIGGQRGRTLCEGSRASPGAVGTRRPIPD